METTIPIISIYVRFSFEYLHKQTLKYETTSGLQMNEHVL